MLHTINTHKVAPDALKQNENFSLHLQTSPLNPKPVQLQNDADVLNPSVAHHIYPTTQSIKGRLRNNHADEMTVESHPFRVQRPHQGQG